MTQPDQKTLKPFRTLAREDFEVTLGQAYEAMLAQAGSPERLRQIPRGIYDPHKSADLVRRYADAAIRPSAFHSGGFKLLQTLAYFGTYTGRRVQVGFSPLEAQIPDDQAGRPERVVRAAEHVLAVLPGVIEPVKAAIEMEGVVADFAKNLSARMDEYMAGRMLSGLVKSASSVEGVRANTGVVLLGAVANAQSCQLELSFVAPSSE